MKNWFLYVVILKEFKRISPYAFSECDEIKFESNRKLEIIDEYSFWRSCITKLNIPPSVTHINSRAFEFCDKLESIEFSENSKLQFIGEFAFNFSSLKCFLIPKNVTMIEIGSFSVCWKLQILEITENSQFHYIDIRILDKYWSALIMIPKKQKIVVM